MAIAKLFWLFGFGHWSLPLRRFTGQPGSVVDQFHDDTVFDFFFPLATAVQSCDRAVGAFPVVAVRTLPHTSQVVLQTFVGTLHGAPRVEARLSKSPSAIVRRRGK